MGVIYEKNNIIPNDKDYDIVKYVPFGYVLSRLDDPGAVYYQGQYVGVKNGIKVNSPDSRWVLETVDEYVKRTGNEDIYEIYGIQRAMEYDKLSPSVSKVEAEREQLLFYAKTLVDSEELEDDKIARDFVGLVSSLLLLEFIQNEFNVDRGQIIKDLLTLDKEELSVKYSLPNSLKSILDFLEKDKEEVLRLFKRFEGSYYKERDKKLLFQLAEKLNNTKDYDEIERRLLKEDIPEEKEDDSFDNEDRVTRILSSIFFKLLLSIPRVKGSVKTRIKNKSEELESEVLFTEFVFLEEEFEESVFSKSKEELLEHIKNTAEELAYEDGDPFSWDQTRPINSILSHILAYLFKEWFPGEEWDRDFFQWLLIDKLEKRAKKLGIDFIKILDIPLEELFLVRKTALLDLVKLLSPINNEEKTSESSIVETISLDSEELHEAIKRVISKTSNKTFSVKYLKSFAEKVENEVLDLERVMYKDRFGNTRGIDAKLFLYAFILFPKLANKLQNKEKFVRDFSSYSGLISASDLLSSYEDKYYEKYKDVIEETILLTDKILYRDVIEEDEIDSLAKLILANTDSNTELLDILTAVSSILLSVRYREKLYHSATVLTYSAYAVWESLLSKIGLSEKIKEIYANDNVDYTESFFDRKEREINSLLLSGTFVFRYTPIAVKDVLEKKVSALDELFKNTIKALGNYKEERNLEHIEFRRIAFERVIEDLDICFGVFKKYAKKILNTDLEGVGFVLQLEKHLDDFRKEIAKEISQLAFSLEKLFPTDRILKSLSEEEKEILKLINGVIIGAVDSLYYSLFQAYFLEAMNKGNFESIAHSAPMVRLLLPKVKTMMIEELFFTRAFTNIDLAELYEIDEIENMDENFLEMVEEDLSQYYTKGFNRPIIFGFLRSLDNFGLLVNLNDSVVEDKEDWGGYFYPTDFKDYIPYHLIIPPSYYVKYTDRIKRTLRVPLTELLNLSDPDISAESYLLWDACRFLYLDEFRKIEGSEEETSGLLPIDLNFLYPFYLKTRDLGDVFLDPDSMRLQKRFGTIKTLKEKGEIKLRRFEECGIEPYPIAERTISITTDRADIEKLLLFTPTKKSLYKELMEAIASLAFFRDFLGQVLEEEELQGLRGVLEKIKAEYPRNSEEYIKQLIEYSFDVLSQRENDSHVREAFYRAASRYLIPLFHLLPFDNETETVIFYPNPLNALVPLRDTNRLARIYGFLKDRVIELMEGAENGEILKKALNLIPEIALDNKKARAVGEFTRGGMIFNSKKSMGKIEISLPIPNLFYDLLDIEGVEEELKEKIHRMEPSREYPFLGVSFTNIGGQQGISSTLVHELGHLIDYLLLNDDYLKDLPNEHKAISLRYRKNLGKIIHQIRNSVDQYQEKFVQAIQEATGEDISQEYDRFLRLLTDSAVSFILGEERGLEGRFSAYGFFRFLMKTIEKAKPEKLLPLSQALKELVGSLKEKGIAVSFYNLLVPYGIEIPSTLLESYATNPMFSTEYSESYNMLIVPMLEFADKLVDYLRWQRKIEKK